jgi:hypothetical protein
MKTERRHELKTNALARFVENSPKFAQRHGNKVLLVIILIFLAVFLVRYRLQQAEDARITAATNLSTAESAINDLNASSLRVLGNQELMAQARNNDISEAEGALDTTLLTAQDPMVRAEANVVRGNLNWILANLPALPAAATQPAMALKKTSEEYLTAAQSAYSEVLKDPLSQNHHAVTAARLGLAAIAENRGDWDAASRAYHQVSDDPATDPNFKTYADVRAKLLDELKHPVLLAEGIDETRQPEQSIGPASPPGILSGLSPFSLNPPAMGPIAPAAPTTAPSEMPATMPAGK